MADMEKKKGRRKFKNLNISRTTKGDKNQLSEISQKILVWANEQFWSKIM